MIITCPHCQAEHDYKVIDHINIDRNPELRAKVQDLSCFRIKCPNCGETALAVHPCPVSYTHLTLPTIRLV